MKTMKKVVLIILALILSLAVFALAACEDEQEHEHNYTKWNYDAETHWKECIDDEAKSDAQQHEFVDGKCECGAMQFSSVSGTVKLCKIGDMMTDFEGVEIDLGDDDVEINFNSTNGEFSIDNLQVNKLYTLTVSKAGYNNYKTDIQAENAENIVLNNVLLENTNAFVTAIHDNWNPTWKHVGSDGHAFTTNSNTVATKSVEAYDQVAVTMYAKISNTQDGNGNPNFEGIWMFFEDGSICPVGIFGNRTIVWDLSTDYGVTDSQWAWKIPGAEDNLFNNVSDSWEIIDGEGNKSYTTENIPQELIDKHDAGMLELTLVRDGADFYFFIDGKLGEKRTIDSAYTDSKVNVGFYAKDTVSNATWKYKVDKDITKYIKNFDLVINKTGNGTVTGGGSDYKIGDIVTLNIAAGDDYHLESFKVDGVDKYAKIINGVYTFRVDTISPVIDIEFAVNKRADIDVVIEGTKYGFGGNSIQDGTEITLKGMGGLPDVVIEVASSKLTKKNVLQGRYLISHPGYDDVEIVVGDNGIDKKISLNYQPISFDNYATSEDWHNMSNYDLTNANSGEISTVQGSTAWGMALLSRDSFGDLAYTLTSKLYNTDNKEFLVMMFDDGSYVAISISMGGGNGFRLEYYPSWESLGWGTDNNPLKKNITKDAWNFSNAFGEELYKTGSDSQELADLKAKYAEGAMGLTLVRKSNMFYIFADGKFIDCFKVDAQYASQKCRFGLFAWGPVIPGTWKYSYTTDVSSYLADIALKADEQMENGTVTFDKTQYKYGEMAKITLSANSGYIPKSITIDGHDVTDKVVGGVLEIRVDGAYTVTAQFEAVSIASTVTIDISSKKHGAEGNTVADGTEVIMRSKWIADKKFTVSGGKIAVSNLPYGAYTLILDGYYNAAITVDQSTANQSVTFVEPLFELGIGWNGEQHDLTHVADEIPTVGNNGTTLNVLTIKSHVQVAASLWVKEGNSIASTETQGIWIKFANEKWRVSRVEKYDGNKYKLQYMETLWSWPVNVEGNWIDFVPELSSEQLAKYKSETGLKYTLVRDGAKIHAFVEDVYTHTLDLDATTYSDLECKIGFFDHDSKANAKWQFNIESDISAYIAKLPSPEPSK